MIDTITIRQSYKQEDKEKLKGFFKDKLILKSDTKYLDGIKGKNLIGSYANWVFYLGDINFKIVGSLTTASKRNNIYNSTYEDIKLAIDELKQLFCLNLDNATILRVDVAYNFILNQPVFNYLNFLVCPESFKANIHPGETLQFTRKGIVVAFYDKIKERAKSKKLPQPFKQKNVLRFEMRIRNEGLNDIGLSKLSFGELSNENSYLKLVDAWFNRYLMIQKKKKYAFPQIESISVSGLKNLALKQFLGTSTATDYITELLADKSVTAKQRHDINRCINSINLGQCTSSKLENELHNKIRMAYCRNLSEVSY
ncbi:phage/plasmid replication protein [Pedobacter gandavensis]|uniref:phage/plasmid replication domain-containing protein n=1 Tax=Pedobacter gandavensis TaxID=2679963 RepID=UPI00292F1AAB|nr:phage/plasmid replication protein [Pedobacter gandavensis]